MKTEVRKSLLRESFRDIQDKFKKQSTKSRNNFYVRFLVYTFVILALIVLIMPGTTNRIVEKYVPFKLPSLTQESQKPKYVPSIYDPMQSIRSSQRQPYNKGADPRFQRIEVINLIDQKHIPPGSEAKAKLISGGTNGLIKAELSEDLKFEGNVYLPRKSVLIGHGTSSEERLFINFKKSITPSGKVLKIAAEGFDINDKLLGLKGKKVSDYAFKIAASSGLIFLGAMAESLQSGDSSGVFQQKKKSIRDAALEGVAASTTTQGKRYLDSLDNESKVEVKFDSSLIVIFDEVENGK